MWTQNLKFVWRVKCNTPINICIAFDKAMPLNSKLKQLKNVNYMANALELKAHDQSKKVKASKPDASKTLRMKQ